MEPYLASLALFAFNFAPKGWAMCDGRLLPINQNQALFSLLGTTYGGDGRVYFALPDLRGRAPMHMGSGHPLGESGGIETNKLTLQNIPYHSHGFTFSPPCNSNPGTTNIPTGNYPAAVTTGSYATTADANLATVQNQTSVLTGTAGGDQTFPTMQPYLVLTFCIALQGIFPSQT